MLYNSLNPCSNGIEIELMSFIIAGSLGGMSQSLL